MAYAIVRSAGNTVCYTTMFIPGDAGMNYETACAEADRINEAFARIAELEAELMKKIEMESFWARHAHNLESSVIPTMKKDYEARIAELEAQIGVLFDTIKRGDHESRERAESDAANFEQLREGYVSAQARITEIEEEYRVMDNWHMLALKKAGADMDELRERNAELESMLATSAELQEAQLQEIDRQAERLADLEALLGKAQNEIIMEASERAAYQVSCAEMEKQMHVKDTYIQQQQIQIASLTEELNNSRQREKARF